MGSRVRARTGALTPRERDPFLIEYVKHIRKDASPRIFVVGDPRDTNVPFTTQALYYRALKKHGLDAHLLEAAGRGKDLQGLSHWAKRISVWCAQNVATEQIVRQVK